MKPLKILFVLCIMLGLTAPVYSQGKSNPHVRPLKGSFYAEVVEEYPTTEVMSIIGNATHFGNVKGSQMTLVRPVPPPPLIATFDGTLVAANGDCAHFTGFSNMVITKPDPLGHAGTMTGKIYFNNGTGRFEGCTGEADIAGIFDMKASCASYSIDGTITY